MKKSEEVRNDVLHRVGHEHLIAVELNLVAGHLNVVLDLREVEDTGEVERVVYIEVNVEQRLVSHRVESFVELVVVLVCQVSRLACPERLYLIDHVILVCIYIFAVLPLLLLAEDYRYRHELAVLVQQTLDASLPGIFLLVFCDIKGDDCTSVCFLTLFHFVFRRAVARPHNPLGAFLP